MRTIKVLAPASVANMVCGFDVLGMALNEPMDEMTVSISEEAGIRIRHTDEFNLPIEPEKNVAGASLLAMMQECDPDLGFDLVASTVVPHRERGRGVGTRGHQH